MKSKQIVHHFHIKFLELESQRWFSYSAHMPGHKVLCQIIAMFGTLFCSESQFGSKIG